MKPISLIRSVVTVGGWTLLSRGAGFARDMMMAAFLGAGPMADAFNVAFALPNMFRRFFAEGAFNMAFVPMFSKKLEGEEDAEGFASDAFSALATLLVGVALIGTLAMPWLVWAMASGFVGGERYPLAILYGQIGFNYILFISLVALLSGVLNTHGHFTETSLVPVLMNVIFIGSMTLGAHEGWNMGLTMACTVPVTGVAQFAFIWIAVRRIGFRMRLRRPEITPELRRLATIAFPAILSGGVVQINMLVGRQVASYTPGAVSWLVYADRLYQLPLGVVGIAIGTVLLPDLSRRLRAKDAAGGRASFNRGAEFALALTLPAAVALIVIAQPLCAVLYQRGAYTGADAHATALALAAYGAGLPAFVLQKVLQPLFYAREDTRSPFRYALWSMLANLVLAVSLSPVIGFVAAAWATTVSGWVMLFQLWHGSRAMGPEAALDNRLLARLPRVALASAVMGLALWFAARALDAPLREHIWHFAALAALVLGGMAVYFLTGAALGAFRLSEFARLARRRV